MMNELTTTDNQTIQNKIYTVRGVQVMLDRDLAALYGVETRALKQAVKRNIERFPEDFMFELIDSEINLMVSQSVIPSKKHLGGAKPFVFTEQGVSTLSSVLSSDTAIKIHIDIMRAFVNMRRFLQNNAALFSRLDTIEKRQISYEIKNDSKVDAILNAIEEKSTPQKQHIFYDGQIFDAYLFGASLKDLGKKWFAVSKMDVDSFAMMRRLK